MICIFSNGGTSMRASLIFTVITFLAATTSVVAYAGNAPCDSTRGIGRCKPCESKSEVAWANDGGMCWSCGLYCMHWEAKAASEEEVGSKRAVEDMTQPRNSPESTPGLQAQFIQMSDVFSVAQINPVAALLSLRFVPEFYSPTAFYEGQAIAERVPSAASVNAAVAGDNSLSSWEKTTRLAPEGTFLMSNWRFIKESPLKSVWRIETYYQDEKTGARLHDAYPAVEMQMTAEEPYRVIGWRIR